MGALRFLTAILAVSLLAPAAAAQGTSHMAGELYNAGAGARALAMGSAHTAVSQDVTSLYYNPAGLGLLAGRQFSLMQASLYEGAAYNYLAYGQNLRKRPGGWGLEILRLGASGGKGRDQFNNASSDFGYSETSMGFGMGYRGVVTPDLSLGFKLKRLSRSLAGSSDQMTGVDLGAQYGPIANDRLTFGLTMQNAFAQVKGDTDDRLAPLVRLGAAYQVPGGLIVALDASSAKDFRIGTEYALGALYLRAGVQQLGMTFGTGFLFRRAYALDIALVNHATFGMSPRVSLGYKFQGAKGRSGGGQRMEAFANEYFNNAMLELQKREYVKALKDFKQAQGINSRVGGSEWREKFAKLEKLLARLELGADEENALKSAGAQASLAQAAVMAHLDDDAPKALLFAHAAHGQDVRNAVFLKLLRGLAAQTGSEVRKEDVLPVPALIGLRLKQAVDAVFAQKFEAGIKACKDALALDPQNATAWMRLGSAYFASGDKLNAAQAYRSALQLEPAHEKLRQFMTQQGMQP